MVFKRLLPWANFSVDEEYYEENDESLWRELHCYYDEEDCEWVVVGEDFVKFRKKLDPMRSIDHSGEVAEYMLIISLNELGNSFLTLDNFLSQKQPYIDAKAVEKDVYEEN